MAYAVHFRFQWRSNNDNVYKIEILQDGYSGSVVQRPLGGAPQLRRNRNGAICGTSLEFLAQAQVDGEFASLYTPSATAYRVDLYQNSTLIWQGYITPELYSEPYIAPPYNVKVTATDNLGELKLSDYAPQGRQTIATLLTYILGGTGLSFPVHWLSKMRPSSSVAVSAADAPSSVRIDLDQPMEGKTRYDALKAILDTYHAIIVQYNCSWLIVRETDLEALRSGTTFTAPDGSTFSLGDFGSMSNSVWWPVGYLSQTVVPAKNEKVITAPNHWIGNILPETATSSTNADYIAPANGNSAWYDLTPYTGSGSTIQPRNCSVAFWSASSEWTPTQDLAFGMIFQTSASMSDGGAGKTCAKVVIRIWGSDGNSSYYRYLNTNGDFVDSEVPAVEISGEYRQAAEQMAVTIPIYSKLATTPFTKIYQVQVTIASVIENNALCALDITDWFVRPQEENKGYQVTCILNNGARGKDGNVEIVAADNVNKALESMLVTNGLLYAAAKGGAPIAEWQSDNVPSLPLLEFLARDYCLSIAVPRLLMEGTMNVPYDTALPLMFRGGGLIYWIDTYDWNLVDDAVNISMTSLPAASVQVTSVTRQAEGSDGIITGGSTAPSSGGGGGGGTGTVTSVGLTMPTGFSVSGSPITSSGTLAVTLATGYAIPTTTQVGNWNTAYTDHHTHSNLALLELITVQRMSGWDTAANDAHTHSNKPTLDGISSSDVTNWNAAYTDKHTHSNKPTLDGISSTNVSNWNGAVTTANDAYAAAVTNKVTDGSDISGSNTNLVAASAVAEYVASHSSNDHVTGFSWTNGTSSGPTGSITQSESSAVSVPAIPAASASYSGIVTTADGQHFAGNKTFDKSVTVSQKMAATALVIPGSAPSGSYVSTSEWYISIDTSAISGSVV